MSTSTNEITLIEMVRTHPNPTEAFVIAVETLGEFFANRGQLKEEEHKKKKHYPREVYALTCIHTGKTYVGSSAYVENRIKQHIYALSGGHHPVEDMQADWDADEKNLGWDYRILDTIKDENERHKEYFWMCRMNTGDRRFGYNYKDPMMQIKHIDPTKYKH